MIVVTSSLERFRKGPIRNGFCMNGKANQRNRLKLQFQIPPA